MKGGMEDLEYPQEIFQEVRFLTGFCVCFVVIFCFVVLFCCQVFCFVVCFCVRICVLFFVFGLKQKEKTHEQN